MYWSVYDFLMLLSGLIALVIVVFPHAGITVRTRVTAGAIGGGLVLISLVLASLPFFRYPAIVIAGPIVALLSVIAVVGKAVRGSTDMQIGEQGHRHSPRELTGWKQGEPATPEPASPQTLPGDLSAGDLMEIAARDQSRWFEIAQHPSAYPGLLDWLMQNGGPAVRDAVAARRAASRDIE